MEWFRQKHARTSFGKSEEGVKFTYGKIDKHVNLTVYIYFLGSAFTPFFKTERMCISDPLAERLYFGDADIEGVSGWKLYTKGGNPHLQFDVANGSEEIEKAWPKGTLYKLQYDQENGIYFIERKTSSKSEACKWKMVGDDIVCPSCGFSVAGIRRGEEFKYCPNCGNANNKEG